MVMSTRSAAPGSAIDRLISRLAEPVSVVAAAAAANTSALTPPLIGWPPPSGDGASELVRSGAAEAAPERKRGRCQAQRDKMASLEDR